MFVRCLETKVVSFDFILNDKGYNENMKKNILNLEEKYTNYSDRTMVYFICVRKKVRFVAKKDNIKNISFSLYKDDIKKQKVMTIPIEAFVSEVIERNNEIKDRSELQSIETTYNNIVFHLKNKKAIEYDIYKFIGSFEIDLGNSSKIVYVGETDFPTNRPFDKPHRGMMNAIYNYKNFGNDIFIHYNVFHIKFQDISNSIIQIEGSNSLFDFLDKRKAGRFIQNAFIKYLLNESYSPNYKKEIGELKNTLHYLKENYNVNEVNFCYKKDSNSDMFSFYSDRIDKTRIIEFTESPEY
jgi:hypothetical protein